MGKILNVSINCTLLSAHCNCALGCTIIQCFWLEELNGNFTVKAYQKQTYPTAVTFAQPTIIEQSIRSFLTEHRIPNAFVTLALTPDANDNTKPESISAHQLLQCQLLAINTPFHCAGITTHELARQYALELGAAVPKGHHAVASQDLLCSIGLYSMTRK